MQISLAWPDLAHLKKKKKKASWKSLLCFTFQTTDAVFGQNAFRKKRQSTGRREQGGGGNRRGVHRGVSEGLRRTHPWGPVRKVLEPWWCLPTLQAVKAPGCERWMPRPERAAPPRHTSPSSAACGSGTGPHYAERRELHPGKSADLERERERERDKWAFTAKVSWYSWWQNWPTVTLNTSIFKFPLELHPIVAAENSSALELSVVKLTLVPGVVGEEAAVIGSYGLEVKEFVFTNLDPSVKKSTPEPWKSPFSNWPE